MLTEKDIDPSLDLEDEINRLKREMNAVILAHYYQEDDVQDIADFIGDSLDLSRKAAATDADVIIFCGVKFMAEVAKILSPQKQVLLPDLKAGCSLEDSCPPKEFADFRRKHADHVSLTYINCSAAVKAESDVIVTSSNAEAIINQIPEDQPILFAPDKYLGGYLAKKTGRDMTLWPGTCQVHEQFSVEQIVRLKTRHPHAKVIAHPECPPNILDYAEHIGSTSSLLKFTDSSDAEEFIVLTEPGIIHQMQLKNPQKKFYDVGGTQGGCEHCNACPYMKLNTLEKLYLCMVNRSPEIVVDAETAEGAKASLDKMLQMSESVVSSI